MTQKNPQKAHVRQSSQGGKSSEARRLEPAKRVSNLPDEAVLTSEWPFELDKEKATPRLVALLFFDYANETADRKLNLAGIFDRLFVDKETKKTVPIGVFVRTAETVDSSVYVSIISPEKKAVGGFAFSIPRKAAEVEGKKYALFQMLARIQFDAPVEGTYWFNVAFDGKSLGGCPLVVEFRNFKETKDGITRGDG
jgi:hypothetical protein